MPIQVYLNFNGNCREAITFYAIVFETEKPKVMTFGDVPSDPEHVLKEEAKNLIMHANLNISGSVVMFSDVLPDMPFTMGNNINLSFSSNNIDEIKSIFNKLKTNGIVEMIFKKHFGVNVTVN